MHSYEDMLCIPHIHMKLTLEFTQIDHTHTVLSTHYSRLKLNHVSVQSDIPIDFNTKGFAKIVHT